MKNFFIPFLSLSFLMTGCLITSQEVRDRRTVTPEQEKRANLESKYAEVEEQTRIYNGRIETLENQVQKLQAEKAALAAEKAADKRFLEERLKIYEEAIGKLETQNLLLAQKVDTLYMAVAEKKKESAVATASASASAKTKDSFQAAEDDFKAKKWTDAILAYEKYRENNPKGKKYAEATYKIGLSFIELGNKSDAKAFFLEVTQKFPKSDWAKKAGDKLKTLK